MIELIAEALAEYLKDVPFADVVVGLVKEITHKDSEDGPLFKYPVHYLKTDAECRRGAYRDLVPDSRKKSIQYVESYGTRVGARHGDTVSMTTTVRAVCWGKSDLITELGAAYVMAAVPETPKVAGLINVRFTPISVLGVDEKIFARYTYKEEELQFLLYPFTAFAVVYEVTYSIRFDCLP
jgi:hypothetical protein